MKCNRSPRFLFVVQLKLLSLLPSTHRSGLHCTGGVKHRFKNQLFPTKSHSLSNTSLPNKTTVHRSLVLPRVPWGSPEPVWFSGPFPALPTCLWGTGKRGRDSPRSAAPRRWVLSLGCNKTPRASTEVWGLIRGELNKNLPAGSGGLWIRGLRAYPSASANSRAKERSQNSQPPLMPAKLKDLQSLLAKPFRSRDE